MFELDGLWGLPLAVPIVFAVLLLLFAFVLRKNNKRFAALIVALCSLYVISVLVRTFLLQSFRTYLMTSPLVLVIDVTPTVIGLLVTVRFFSLYLFRGKEGEGVLDYSSPTVLKETVSKILDSEKFLTALRSTLPAGKDDEQFGFDYIPFMLNSIDERRRRAVRASRFFLLATIFSALIFSGVVVYFGYILVNEASAGTAKTLSDIRTAAEATSEALHSITPSYFNNSKFRENVAPYLERLVELEPGDKNKPTKDKLVGTINDAKRTGDLSTLNDALAHAAAEVSKLTDEEKNYSNAVANAMNGMSAFLSSQSVAIPELNSRIVELKMLIPKAEEALSKPENRLPEIIKRLALGLVIATFFLALLRYMGTLYRTRYQQVLAAEDDDFMVRRFYVAFKSSMPSDEQRKAVLSSFMVAHKLGSGTDSKEPDTGTKQEYEMLKDLLGALSKKL